MSYKIIEYIFCIYKKYMYICTQITTSKKIEIMKTVNFKRAGHGQWTASTEHYGKIISIHFTDAPTYDLINSEERGYKKAIKSLRSRIINYHK